MQYILYTLLYIKWWTVSFCVLIWTYITVPGVHFIILFTNFLAIYGDSTHNNNEECYGECTILPSPPNGEKLSGSNAFSSRTIGGLNHNPCFNGIWQEFCQTSPSAGQKRRECGNKHPTGGSVPLIPSINKIWIVWNFDDGRPLLNKSWCEDWGIHVIILEYFNSYWGSFFSP